MWSGGVGGMFRMWACKTCLMLCVVVHNGTQGYALTRSRCVEKQDEKVPTCEFRQTTTGVELFKLSSVKFR